MSNVHVKRHFAKTISYRIISTLIGILIVILMGGNLTIISIFGFGELLVKPFLYFLHERFWYKYISYGIKKE